MTGTDGWAIDWTGEFPDTAGDDQAGAGVGHSKIVCARTCVSTIIPTTKRETEYAFRLSASTSSPQNFRIPVVDPHPGAGSRIQPCNNVGPGHPFRCRVDRILYVKNNLVRAEVHRGTKQLRSAAGDEEPGSSHFGSDFVSPCEGVRSNNCHEPSFAATDAKSKTE
jgi:hypothetical protein